MSFFVKFPAIGWLPMGGEVGFAEFERLARLEQFAGQCRPEPVRAAAPRQAFGAGHAQSHLLLENNQTNNNGNYLLNILQS